MLDRGVQVPADEFLRGEAQHSRRGGIDEHRVSHAVQADDAFPHRIQDELVLRAQRGSVSAACLAWVTRGK